MLQFNLVRTSDKQQTYLAWNKKMYNLIGNVSVIPKIKLKLKVCFVRNLNFPIV